MSQNDFVVANAPGSTVRADINSALQALATLSSGASAPSTTYAHQLWADTTVGALKRRNAANSGWIVVRTLDETFLLSRSSNTILGVSDIGKAIAATAGFTQTFTAAATLGDGWWVAYKVAAGVTVTFDPNSSEQIDAATTKAVVGPSSGFIYCSGAAFFTVGFPDAASDTVAGVLEIATQAEMEAASDTTRAVSPGRQHFHPSAAKFWVRANVDGTIDTSYNVTSVTDDGTGEITVNLTSAYSASTYPMIAVAQHATLPRHAQVETGSSTAPAFRCYDDATTLSDPTRWHIAGFGDL